MAQSTTVISLPQMVDLALNTPEVGIVNFTVLHSLLHVIINRLDLTETNVEFRGIDSERIQNYITSSQPTGNTLTLTEYIIGSDNTESEKLDKKKKRVSIDSEKGKADETEKEKSKKVKSEDRQKQKSIGSLSDDAQNKSTVVLVQSSKGSIGGAQAQFTVAVTKEHFDKMQNDIERLEAKVNELQELPGNPALIDAIRSESSEKTPVLDMFQILNLKKRVDAADEAIAKFASMIEELAKGSITEVGLPEKLEGFRHSVESAGRPSIIKNLESRVEELEKMTAAEGGIVPKGEPSSFDASADIEKIDFSRIPIAKSLEIIKAQIINMQTNSSTLPQIIRDIEELKALMSGDSDVQPVEIKVKRLEAKYAECVEQIASLDGGFSRQVNGLMNRLGDLEREFGEVSEKVHLMSEDATDKLDSNITTEMHNQLMQLQEDFQRTSEIVQKLSEDDENRQHSLDVLVEQIELLKTVKADKEDLEDALADKADACQINRKVSFEQFDQACGDMTKNLEIALAKLSQQESLWNQALEDIQKEVGSKLDRMELNPLRDFINNKLKTLQEKFKTLSALKKEHEAAGTKSKYLRNVNCISCDKDVVMRKEMDPSLYPKPYALPPTRNMGPYLAYELDQLRKQQKCLPSSKNLNVFENALHTKGSAKSPDHVCNRYCGGSHTVTTPQQRVTRLGHFLEQWGPEISPVNDTHVRGTDGQMYKGRDDHLLSQLAAEKPPAPPHSDNIPSIVITPPTPTQKHDVAVGLKQSIPNQERQRSGSALVVPSKTSVRRTVSSSKVVTDASHSAPVSAKGSRTDQGN